MLKIKVKKLNNKFLTIFSKNLMPKKYFSDGSGRDTYVKYNIFLKIKE